MTSSRTRRCLATTAKEISEEELDPSRRQTQLEEIYPANIFSCPAYAIAGNHDYQRWPDSKVAAELTSTEEQQAEQLAWLEVELKSVRG